MTHDPEVLRLECTLALARYLETDPGVFDPFGLACGMFFAGVDTQAAAPRALADVEAELLRVRERSATQPAARPDFLGEGHANHRPRTDPATPARRKGDAQDAAFAAELAAETQRARNRDRAQRAAAHQHPWE